MKDYGDIEPIVRRFCEIRGIDPDGYAPIPCPDNKPGCCVAHFGPAWKRYEEQVREGMALIEALGSSLTTGEKA